ncbi:MAG: hypothetical protein RIQ71_1033 [Verrucomicrobiota bacterium]|jgi:hypothetical protein
MIEPNFGEGQLQQVVNTAFTQFALNHHGVHANPIIPTLVAEHGLGWDTAFYFPWLGYLPLDNHDGCNFFIQYKASKLIEGTRGAQWQEWKDRYFRFQIPHIVKKGKTHVPDYHQFDSLRCLAEYGCEVYYATNHVTSREDLFAEADSCELLEKIPFLDVRDMADRHFYVTFTAASDHFYLHSYPVKARRLTGFQALNAVCEGKRTDLTEGNEKLLGGLKVLAESNEGVIRYIEQYHQLDEVNLPAVRKFRALAKFYFLRAAFRQVVGANLYRI